VGRGPSGAAAGAQRTLAQRFTPPGAEVSGRTGRWAARGEVSWALLGYMLEKPLGLTGLRRGPRAREGWEARLGQLGGIRPMANRK
jgi:hypothetical protein